VIFKIERNQKIWENAQKVILGNQAYKNLEIILNSENTQIRSVVKEMEKFICDGVF